MKTVKYSKIDSEVKKKWVEALRSGKYKQTVELLCRYEDGKKSYCCLGVLYESTGKSLVKKDDDCYGIPYTSKGFKEIEATDLPPFFRKKIGMDADTQSKLIGMNDGSGMSFKQIANWIEKYL